MATPTQWYKTQKLLIYIKSNNNSLLSQHRQMTRLRIRHIADKQLCDKQQQSTAVPTKRATRLNK